SLRSSGVKSIRSSSRTPWMSIGAGRVGNGCVLAATSPGTLEGGTSRSSIGQTGSPVTRSKTYTKACFVTWATALIYLPLTVMSRPVDGYGDGWGCGGGVGARAPVRREWVVPALPRGGARDAAGVVTEKPAAGGMPAVIVVSRSADRQIDVAELLVRAHRCPD